MWKKGLIFRWRFIRQKYLHLPSILPNTRKYHIRSCCFQLTKEVFPLIARVSGPQQEWGRGCIKKAWNCVIQHPIVMLTYKETKLSLKDIKYFLNTEAYDKSKWTSKIRGTPADFWRFSLTSLGYVIMNTPLQYNDCN